MISFSPNCLWANGKDILVNKPYREQREKKWKRAEFNASCGLGRTVSRSQTGMLISWHRGALVEQLNEMFSL